MTQKALGALLGKSARTVSSIEKGNVTLPVLLKAMGKLEKGLADLGPEEKRPGPPRTQPEPQGGVVPLSDLRAALEALRSAQARIRELEETDGKETPLAKRARLGAERAKAKRLDAERAKAGSDAGGKSSAQPPHTKDPHQKQ